MAHARRLRNVPHVVEDHRAGHLIPQVMSCHNLLGSHIKLDMPAERIDPFRQRPIISMVVGARRGFASEKRMPRIPPSASVFNSASVMSGRITATPRAFGPNRAIAFSVTRLSVAYASGVTITSRVVPIRAFSIWYSSTRAFGITGPPPGPGCGKRAWS